MAGLGIGPGEFALFAIRDPDECADALEAKLTPALARIGRELVGGLARVTADDLIVHPARPARRKGHPPAELLVAFGASDKGYRATPYLAMAVTRGHLHARVGVRAAVDRSGVIRRALEREAGNLARKGKPFRKLRNYAGWDYEELPEIAPAHSSAFWRELADDLGSDRNGGCGLDVGVAWTAEEARSLAVGDVLGAFRDLAPLYKLLVSARP
jgi:hypothetical protein